MSIETMTNFANLLGALTGREDERRERREERTFEYAMAQWMQDAQTAKQANLQKLDFVMKKLGETDSEYKRAKEKLDNLGLLSQAIDRVKNPSTAGKQVVEQEAKDLSQFISGLDLSRGNLQDAMEQIKKETNAMEARIGSLNEVHSKYQAGYNSPLVSDIIDRAGTDRTLTSEDMKNIREIYRARTFDPEGQAIANDDFAWAGIRNKANELLPAMREMDLKAEHNKALASYYASMGERERADKTDAMIRALTGAAKQFEPSQFKAGTITATSQDEEGVETKTSVEDYETMLGNPEAYDQTMYQLQSILGGKGRAPSGPYLRPNVPSSTYEPLLRQYKMSLKGMDPNSAQAIAITRKMFEMMRQGMSKTGENVLPSDAANRVPGNWWSLPEEEKKRINDEF